jgi:GxxExxY protein
MYGPTSYEESLARNIVACVYKVHSNLGPGLLEAVYEHCLCYELEKCNISYAKQVAVPLLYDGNKLPWGVRLDVLVGDRINVY